MFHLGKEIVLINPYLKSRECKERKMPKLSGKDEDKPKIIQKVSICYGVEVMVSVSVSPYQLMKFLARQEHLDKTL